MRNKLLKAGVLALMLGISGSAMAVNDGILLILNPYDDFGNTTSTSLRYQTVIGSNNATDGLRASVYGTSSSATGTDTTAIGSNAVANANYSTAIGSYVTTTGAYSVAFGSGASVSNKTTAGGEKSVAIGYTAKTSANEAVALGSEANVKAANAVAVGKGATVDTNAAGGLAIGTSSQAKAANATAIGVSGYAGAENSTAIGTGSRVADTATGGVAIGNGAYVTKAGSVAIGEGAAVSATKNPTDKVVSFGHTTYDTYYDAAQGKDVAYDSAVTARLVNVTAGYQDTDAVNFSQINTVARSGNDLKNGTYIESSKTDDTTLNANGTVGANIAALDAKAVSSAQTVVLSDAARDTAKAYTGKKNEIVSNDGTVLASFDYAKIEDSMSDEDRAKFVSAGDVYDAIAKRSQTVSLDAATTHDVNGKKIQGNQIATNDGTVLATFETEKPSSLTGKKFVTSGDVYAADVMSAQTVTLDATTTHDVNGKKIQGNQIATNEGTVVATFDVETEKPTASSKKFVNSGQVYNADTKVQTITLDNTKKANILKNNADEDLVTFQLAEYQSGDKGFVNGGQLFDQSIAAGQEVSFATGKNVIKNNKKDELVSFTEGVVAVAGGAKGATNTDTNFVSARNAYANDVAYAQDLTLNIGNSYTADIVTNAGAKVGTLKIVGGEVASGNYGFVTGDQVWKAIASYNQKLDFSDVTPSNKGDAESVNTNEVQPAVQGDVQNEGNDLTEPTAAPKSSNVIYSNDGTPIAELTQGEVSYENDGFVSGGQVYAEDVEAGQNINLTNNVIKNNAKDKDLVTFQKAEVLKDNDGFATGGQVWSNSIAAEQNISFEDGKNVIKNNADNQLVTFTKADVSEENNGFATGGQVWSNAIAADQTVSFETTTGDDATNVIKNNDGTTLVTFKVGKAEKDNTGFVSGDAAWKGDVAKGDVSLAEGENVIKSNSGDTLVTIQKGEVKENNSGFVSGGQVYSAVQEVTADIDDQFTAANTRIDEANTRIDKTEQNVSQLSGRVSDVDDRVKEVGAGAAALAALHPMDYDPNAKLTFAVGYGNYKSKSAAAIGAFVRPNDRVMWSLGATIGNGNNMVNTGLSFAIGRGSGSNMSRAELAGKVNQMAKEIEKLESEHKVFNQDNQQQNAAILDLHARLKIIEEFIQKLAQG